MRKTRGQTERIPFFRRGRPLAWIALGAVWLAGCNREQPYRKPLTPVSVRAVEEYQAGGGQRYSGNIEPYSQVNVAFKSGGYVQEILQVNGRNVQEGDHVSRDQVLARVRPDDYQAKVNEARAAVGQAEAGLAQAKFALAEAQAGLSQAGLDLDRATNLFKTQSLTKADYDGAKTKREVGQARVDQARAQLQLADARIQTTRAQLQAAEIAFRDTELRAPMDGWVLKRLIEVGSLVGPGTGAFVLADTREVKVVFGAPDMLLPRLRMGTPLAISTEAIPDRTFAGRITRIAPAADPRTRVFDVEISIPNPGNALKAGMIAALEVPVEKRGGPVTVVPLTAIVRSKDDPNSYGVFVLEKEGTNLVPRARTVALGEAFGNLVAVSQGVKPGEQVIVTGATLVRDGEPVQVVP